MGTMGKLCSSGGSGIGGGGGGAGKGAGSGRGALCLMDGGLAECGSMSLAQPVLVTFVQIQIDAKMAETTPTNCGMCQ